MIKRSTNQQTKQPTANLTDPYDKNVKNETHRIWQKTNRT